MQGDSHDQAVHKGRSEIQAMIDHFMIRPREECVEAAHRLYRLALQQGFTRGRRVNQVGGGQGSPGVQSVQDWVHRFDAVAADAWLP